MDNFISTSNRHSIDFTHASRQIIKQTENFRPCKNVGYNNLFFVRLPRDMKFSVTNDPDEPDWIPVEESIKSIHIFDNSIYMSVDSSVDPKFINCERHNDSIEIIYTNKKCEPRGTIKINGFVIKQIPGQIFTYESMQLEDPNISDFMPLNNQIAYKYIHLSLM